MVRRLKWRHVLRAALALLVVIIVGAGVAVLSFDPNSLKPRIIEAVKRETGRDIALNGPITIAFALHPTLAAQDVAFPNPPGFSRPQMVTLARLDLQLALFPLLTSRVEIERLVLVRPDIMLETDAQGHPNWQFTPDKAGAPKSSSTAADTGPKAPAQISVADVRIQDGSLTWRNGKTQQSAVLGVKRLEATAASPNSPVHLDAAASAYGTDLTLAGDVGPLARLTDQASEAPWPVQLTLTAAGGKLTLDGAVTKPLQGRGYTLKLTATVPDLAALQPFLPDEALPPLHDVSLAAQVADTGGALPELSALTLRVGRSDLTASVAGLKLEQLDVAAARLDQPVTLSARGSFADQPLSVAATLGAPTAMWPGAQSAGPFPVDVTMQAAGASFTLKGDIAQLQALTGVDLAVTAKVANLAALSPLLRRPLPALQSIAFEGTLHDANGGLRQGIAVQAAKLSLPQGDIAGDATFVVAARPWLQANVKSNKIDLDALRAAFGAPQGEPAIAAAPAPTSPPAPPPSPQAKNGRIFSDTPLPFDLLRPADADVTLAVGELKSGGALYHTVAAHLVLRGGKLTLDPFAADLPEGHVTGALAIDAAQSPPIVAIRLHAPALAVQPLLAAVGKPGLASGNLEVYADLSGVGGTPQAIAASVDGSLGLAMVNGSIDNRLLGSTLGSILREINLLDLVGRGGTSQVQCFASRIDAKDGIGTFRALTLASTLLTADAGGNINFGAETLSLSVRAQGRVGGTGIVVPLRVSGPLRAPVATPEPAAAVAANAGTIAGIVGSTTPLGMIAGAMVGQKLLGAAPGEDCGTALAVARGGAVGQQPTPSPAAKPKQPDVGNILRQLLR